MERRVISFALYGNDPMYTKGAIENAKLQPKIYPGWCCRFYVNRDVTSNIVNELRSLGAEVIILDTLVNFKSKFVRMEIALDKSVDRFIIRDTDSRLNKREAAAVSEWIASGKPVHIMRDHRNHTSPMMGGMWGAVHGFISTKDFEFLYDNWIKDLRQGKHKGQKYCKKNGQSDQGFLGNKIWPLIGFKSKHIAHDNHGRYTKEEKPFVVRLATGRFVGQQFDENNKPIKIRITGSKNV